MEVAPPIVPATGWYPSLLLYQIACFGLRRVLLLMLVSRQHYVHFSCRLDCRSVKVLKFEPQSPKPKRNTKGLSVGLSRVPTCAASPDLCMGVTPFVLKGIVV